MINKFIKKFIFGLTFVSLLTPYIIAEDVFLYDNSFSINNTQGTLTLSARWGVWDDASFTQAVMSNVIHSGYVDASAPEITVNLSQTNNAVYTQNSQFALAIFTDGSSDAQSVNWPNATHAVVLTDSSWLAPAFSDAPTPITFNFSTATTAVLGTFSYNGGNELISLSAVPEPATFAVLFGAVVLGFSGCRRRRFAC